MESTASQLTQSGLEQLDQLLKPGEPSILFRNNHFSTIMKKNNKLWALVTDQGYLESAVVWESLSIHGDSEFVDGYFMPIGDYNDSYSNQLMESEQNLNQDGYRFGSTTTSSSQENHTKGKKPKKQSDCSLQ